MIKNYVSVKGTLEKLSNNGINIPKDWFNNVVDKKGQLLIICRNYQIEPEYTPANYKQ